MFSEDECKKSKEENERASNKLVSPSERENVGRQGAIVNWTDCGKSAITPGGAPWVLDDVVVVLVHTDDNDSVVDDSVSVLETGAVGVNTASVSLEWSINKH